MCRQACPTMSYILLLLFLYGNGTQNWNAEKIGCHTNITLCTHA